MRRPEELVGIPSLSELEALTSQLDEMAKTSASAEAVLAGFARGLFPDGAPRKDQLTWSEAEAHDARQAEVGEGLSAEQRARSAEAKFRTLIEQIPAVVFFAVLGEGKNEIYVSPHIEQMLGFSQQEWLEAPFLWYWQLHPDDRELWNAEFARGIQTGGPFRGECRFFARDGRVVWVHGEARLIRDERGRPMTLQGVAFDITENKRAQEAVLNETRRSAKIREELAIAHRVQVSILPRQLTVEGLEISAAMVPAEQVGGDYYDVLPFAGGAWLAIGDVSGHGLNAGLIMLMVQSAMGALTRSASISPKQVLATVNELLFDNIRDRLIYDDHVTLTLLRYERGGTLTFAGAHEDLIVYRQATGQVEQLPTPGSWLGAMPDIRAATVDTELVLHDGDLLVLYTDGVTEAKNAAGEPYEIDRLVQAVRQGHELPCEQLRDQILKDVRAWMARQADDITLVVIRQVAPASPPVAAKAPRPDDAKPESFRFPVVSILDADPGTQLLPELSLEKEVILGLAGLGRASAGAVGIKLSGFADDLQQTPLKELLSRLHQVALSRRVPVVEVELREVKYMSASCLKCLLGWLSNILALPAGEQYRVRFVMNPFVRWQRPSLNALAGVAAAVLVIER